MMRGFVISLDPAQLVDYAALSVLEVTRADGAPKNIYKLRSLNRKQHVPYPVIMEWTKETFLKSEFRKDVTFAPILIIDRGGPGIVIQEDLALVGIKARGITLTGGRNWSHDEGSKNLTVSKSLMIDRFLGIWDSGRLQISTKASFWGLFRSELKDFRGGLNKLRQDSKYEGAIGKHDDLILSIAQATWMADMLIKPRRYFKVPPVASFCVGQGVSDENLSSGEPHICVEWDMSAQARREGEERRLKLEADKS